MKIKTNKVHQQSIFDSIRTKIPSNKQFANEIADLLEVSLDSAYRRIRGQKELSFQETALLCKEYDISFDELIFYNRVDSKFKFTPHTDKSLGTNFLNILRDFLSTFKRLDHFTDVKLFAICNDIPLFYLLKYPALRKFLMMELNTRFVNTLQNDWENLISKKINEENEEIIQIANELFTHIQKYTSVEIWSKHCFNNIFKRIEYYSNHGLLDKTMESDIWNELKDLIDYFTTRIKETEKHILDNSFQGSSIYYNEYFSDTNYFYIKSNEMTIMYVKLFQCNYVSCSDEKLIRNAEHWMQELLSKSIHFNSVQQKHTFQYLIKQTKLLNQYKRRLNCHYRDICACT